jgi:sulfate permease, SulP family
VAVEVGLFAAGVTFIYRIAHLTRIEAVSEIDHPLLADLRRPVRAWRVHGALFFGAVQLLETIEDALPPTRACKWWWWT